MKKKLGIVVCLTVLGGCGAKSSKYVDNKPVNNTENLETSEEKSENTKNTENITSTDNSDNITDEAAPAVEPKINLAEEGKIRQISMSETENHPWSGAVTENGNLYMWGYNYDGQVGDGGTEDQKKPVKVFEQVKTLVCGFTNNAAITESGELYMWGDDEKGQIGNGTKKPSTPVKILDNVSMVSLGNYHSGAITKDGELYMWGENKRGEAGDGTTRKRTTPKRIKVS